MCVFPLFYFRFPPFTKTLILFFCLLIRFFSNIFARILQAEPSPTTGSFMKPQAVHGPASSAAHPVTTVCTNTNSFNERNPSCFEFKPHATSNMVLFNEYSVDENLKMRHDLCRYMIRWACRSRYIVNHSLPKFRTCFKLCYWLHYL